MAFSFWVRTMIATLVTFAYIAVANAEPTLVSVQLECGKTKNGKKPSYRMRFNGVADESSLSILFEDKNSFNGKTSVTSLAGYSTKGGIIIRGKGKTLNKNKNWDYLFSLKSKKLVIDALKEGIEGKEEPNTTWERKCSLKLISEKPISHIIGDLALYSAAKREVQRLKEKLAAERKKNLEQKNEVAINLGAVSQTPVASATSNNDIAAAGVSGENPANQSAVQTLGDIRSNFVGAGNQTAVITQNQRASDLRQNYVGNQSAEQLNGTGNTVSQNQIENLGKIAGALVGQDEANAAVATINKALDSLQTNQTNTQQSSQASDQTNAAPVTNVTGAVKQPVAVSSGDDVEVFLSKRAYKFIQKLDGSVKFSGVNIPDERLGAYCAYWLFGEKKWHEAGAEKINSGAIWPHAREFFEAFGITEPKQKILVADEECKYSGLDGPSVFFAQKRARKYLLKRLYTAFASDKIGPEHEKRFAEEWLKIGEIPAGKVSQSIAFLEQKKQQQQQFYQQLVQSGEPTHISSALVRLPKGTDVTFCGYSRSDQLTKAMEYLPEVAPLEELVHEQFARLINSQFIAGRYYRSMLFFESNEAFYEAWQMPDNPCHVFAAHPQDLDLVLHAAKKLQPDFDFLISPLWSVKEVFNRQALKEGFETVKQLYLKETLGSSTETVLKLAAHGISSIDRYNFIKEELQLSGYSDEVDPDKVLKFLDDRKEARSLGISMAELKKKQEKEKAEEEERRRVAAAEARKEEERRQELARQRAAARVASGDGYFGNSALMDSADCSQSFMTCVSRSDFLKICKQGEFAGWANKFNVSPVHSAIGLSERERPVGELYRSAGTSVVSTYEFGVVGRECIWEFSISGTHKGSSIYRKYRCPIHSLMREGNKLYPWKVVSDASWLGTEFKGQCTTSR